MAGSVNPQLIALWASIAVPLGAGALITLASIRAGRSSIRFSIIFGAMLLDMAAIVVFVSLGLSYLDWIRAALLVMAALLLGCILIGSVRGLRSGRTIPDR